MLLIHCSDCPLKTGDVHDLKSAQDSTRVLVSNPCALIVCGMTNFQNTPKVILTTEDAEWSVMLYKGYVLSDLVALQWGSIFRKADRQIRALGEIAYQRNIADNVADRARRANRG